MEQGVTADALPASAEGLVLDAAEQQALLDGIGDLEARLPGDRQITEQAAMAAFVFDAMLLDMARQGLREERDALLAAHFGSAPAAEISAGADLRAAERGLSP